MSAGFEVELRPPEGDELAPRSPCRYAIRIIVALRWPWRPVCRAAAMSCSTSSAVRYSRGRRSAFGRRGGGTGLRTFSFSLLGAVAGTRLGARSISSHVLLLSHLLRETAQFGRRCSRLCEHGNDRARMYPHVLQERDDAIRAQQEQLDVRANMASAAVSLLQGVFGQS
jgi:hypothetical protein